MYSIGMMAHGGRHIDIGIRMMQRVKAREERHRLLAPMHGVTKKIEQQKARRQGRPGIGDWPRWVGAP